MGFGINDLAYFVHEISEEITYFLCMIIGYPPLGQCRLFGTVKVFSTGMLMADF